MSNVKIKGNLLGTGNITIEAPNTDSELILNLPNVDGELLTTNGDASGLQNIESAFNTQIGGRRNLIINGAMQVAQRGTSEIGTSNYFLDRWKKQSSTNANVTFSQDTADTPDGFRYALKAVATGSSSFIQMGQPIEFKNMAHALGKTVTLSYWAKTNLSFYSRIRSRTDTEDATTVFTATTLSVITESASTDWKLFTHTFTVPSTTLAMSVDFSTVALVSGDYFQITGVQLEVGSVATPFEHRSYGEELALCQRYYQIVGDMMSPWVTAGAVSTSVLTCMTHIPIQMRSAPTITQWGDAGATTYQFASSTSNVVARMTNIGDYTGDISTLQSAPVGNRTIFTYLNMADSASTRMAPVYTRCDAEL